MREKSTRPLEVVDLQEGHICRLVQSLVPSRFLSLKSSSHTSDAGRRSGDFWDKWFPSCLQFCESKTFSSSFFANLSQPQSEWWAGLPSLGRSVAYNPDCHRLSRQPDEEETISHRARSPVRKFLQSQKASQKDLKVPIKYSIWPWSRCQSQHWKHGGARGHLAALWWLVYRIFHDPWEKTDDNIFQSRLNMWYQRER